jgi:uncharacterized cupin superfamily protein
MRSSNTVFVHVSLGVLRPRLGAGSLMVDRSPYETSRAGNGRTPAEGTLARLDEPLVINLADAEAFSHSRGVAHLSFEREDAWPDTGVSVQVMQPGKPNCRYHSEPVQEDFLVLHGECIAILNGEERRLRQWDFVHCPAGTEHVFVGAGDRACALLMIGSRREDAPHYPVSELAAKYDASVRSATDDPGEAYADWRQEPWRPTSNPWPLRGP